MEAFRVQVRTPLCIDGCAQIHCRYVVSIPRPCPVYSSSRPGDAPLLQEFEVSCADSTSFTDWSWLPSISPLYRQAPHPTAALTSLVLTNVPFKYSSPIFTSGSLRALHLHGLPSLSLPLDRVLHLITSNPSLESLALYFSSLTPPVLPLPNADISPVRLSKLHTLHVNGHPLLAHVVDVLVCPALEALGMEVDMNAPMNSGMGVGMGGHAGMGRDPVEETVINLVRRSGHPDVTSLYIAYTTYSASGLGGGIFGFGGAGGVGGAPYPGAYHYLHPGSVISWSFLAEMTSLEKLEVRGTQLEPLVSALSLQDDDTGTVIGIGPGIVGVAVGGGMGGGIGVGPGGGGVGAGAGNLVCPRLKSLVARESQGYPDGIAKLVQMVEARNPDVLPVGAGSGAGAGAGAGGGDGAVPSRLCKLEIWDCVPLGADVIDWLKKRVEDVVVVDPPYSKQSSSSGGWM